MKPDILSDAWVRVNRRALRHNLEAIQELLRPQQVAAVAPRLIAVVKANAFGHGAVETALTLQDAGAEFFAVTTPAEALELREGGVNARILVFLPPLPNQLPALLEADVDITLNDEVGLASLADAATRHAYPVRVHLKVDTGMARLGSLPDAALRLGRKLASEPRLEFTGIYTHFARALERDPACTERQFALFLQVTRRLQTEGIDVGLRHCANSAALLRFPQMRLDAVRPGTILYGQYPSPEVPRILQLQDTWTLQARIVALRDVPRGSPVGYGGEHVTRRATRLAVVPMGYADGFTVAPSSASAGWRGVRSVLRGLVGRGSGPFVYLHNKRAPVLGRVAMQICTVDVTDIPEAKTGDIADIPSRRITTSALLPRIYED